MIRHNAPSVEALGLYPGRRKCRKARSERPVISDSLRHETSPESTKERTAVTMVSTGSHIGACIANYSSHFKPGAQPTLPATERADQSRDVGMRDDESAPGYDPDELRAAMARSVNAAPKRLKISKEELFRRAGVKSNTFGKYLRGDTGTLELATAIKIANACELSLSEFIGQQPKVNGASSATEAEALAVLSSIRTALAGQASVLDQAIEEASKVLRQARQR